MRLEEPIGPLKVHELSHHVKSSRDEEQALLFQAFKKDNKNQKGSSSHGRRRGRGGKGKVKDLGGEEDREKKPFDKSKVKC